MNRRRNARYTWFLVLALLAMALPALAAPTSAGAAPSAPTTTLLDAGPVAGEPPGSETKSLIDFILAGKTVGFAIILLSFVGIALVIDSFLRITHTKMIPPLLARQSLSLAREARVGEIVRLARANDSPLGRVLAEVLSRRPLSLAGAREGFQEEGGKEVARLQHRVNYIGFIAAVAPMLGLLGTVTGMIYSFNVLGTSKGAARPDELAVGVAEALVTTCEGLIVAIPLMFFHLYFRGRVTRIGQAAGGVCEGVLRGLAAVIEARTTGRPVEQDLRPTQEPTEVVEEYELEARPGEKISPEDLHFEDDEAGRA